MRYKNYDIEIDSYCGISVQYCGDDIIFDTIDDAKKFIDELEA